MKRCSLCGVRLDADESQCCRNCEHDASVGGPFGDGLVERAIAQLRHAYQHLKAGTVIDQEALADGLISPVITVLESALQSQRAEPVETTPCVSQ